MSHMDMFFIHSSVDGHLGCSHVLAIVNSACGYILMGIHIAPHFFPLYTTLQWTLLHIFLAYIQKSFSRGRVCKLFPVKCQIVNIVSVTGQMASVTTIELYCSSMDTITVCEPAGMTVCHGNYLQMLTWISLYYFFWFSFLMNIQKSVLSSGPYKNKLWA